MIASKLPKSNVSGCLTGLYLVPSSRIAVGTLRASSETKLLSAYIYTHGKVCTVSLVPNKFRIYYRYPALARRVRRIANWFERLYIDAIRLSALRRGFCRLLLLEVKITFLFRRLC